MQKSSSHCGNCKHEHTRANSFELYTDEMSAYRSRLRRQPIRNTDTSRHAVKWIEQKIENLSGINYCENRCRYNIGQMLKRCNVQSFESRKSECLLNACLLATYLYARTNARR